MRVWFFPLFFTKQYKTNETLRDETRFSRKFKKDTNWGPQKSERNVYDVRTN